MYQKIITLSLVLCATAALTACGTSYPLNISESQWLVLTPEQQFEAHLKQAELTAMAQERRVAQAREQEALALQRAAELELAKANAPEQDRLQCILSSASILSRNEWHTIRPLAMDMVRGFDETYKVDVQRRQEGVQVSFTGLSIELCPEQRNRQIECIDVYATQRQFQQGIEFTLDKNSFLTGVLYCDTLPTNDRNPSYRWR